MLIFNRRPGERIVITIPPGTHTQPRFVVLQIGESRKSRVVVKATSPREIGIYREEICPASIKEQLPPCR